MTVSSDSEQYNKTSTGHRSLSLLTEQFQKATAACLRALSIHPDAEVSYGLIPHHDGHKKVRLTVFSKGEWEFYRHFLRGESDSAASRLRFHDPVLHSGFQPESYLGREILEAFELVRNETMAARDFKGVKDNIQQRYKHAIQPEIATDQPPLHRIIQMLGWHAIFARTGVNEDLAALIHPLLAKSLQKHLTPLTQALTSQKDFALCVMQILREIGIEADQNQNPAENESPAQNDPPKDDSAPDPAEAANDPDQPQQNQNSSAEESLANQIEQNAQKPPAAESDQQTASPLPLSRFWESQGRIEYQAFTTEFDETARAEDLCAANELVNLRQSLDQYLLHMPQIVTRLANKLQRKLQAQQLRHWDFNQEEGAIDPTRLPRLVTDPMAQHIYRRERQTNFNDTVVSLLLDNSGSMRGRPIILAALSADILARTLERCGVKVEILGFTTKSWKGGQPYEKWIAAGKPPHPGRLNDLRHIIYKSADTPWRRCKQNLGVMLREGLLKENIDGEALLWAHRRLLGRTEKRKILMVISDGAPVDDLTTSANGGIYLERHLRAVINWIETKSPVELVAIGIGHDVTRYYQNAVTIADVEQLGPVMLGQLGALFEQ